jgi:hypothetical protein
MNTYGDAVTAEMTVTAGKLRSWHLTVGRELQVLPGGV